MLISYSIRSSDLKLAYLNIDSYSIATRINLNHYVVDTLWDLSDAKPKAIKVKVVLARSFLAKIDETGRNHEKHQVCCESEPRRRSCPSIRAAGRSASHPDDNQP